MDTDSIITDLDLSANERLNLKWRPDGTGTALGSLKNERGQYPDGRDKPYTRFYGCGSKNYAVVDDTV